MDFQKVAPLIIGEFKKANVRYALIGGFAMGALGLVRSTVDMDFLIDARDLEKAAGVMKKYGYRCVFHNNNVSQYVADVRIFGAMDFLHALRPIAMAMLKNARTATIFDDKHTVKVVRPEDIIGLKIQAAENDPSRRTKEYADIEALMGQYRQKLDWTLLEEYFGLFGKNTKYKKLRSLYGTAK